MSALADSEWIGVVLAGLAGLAVAAAFLACLYLVTRCDAEFARVRRIPKHEWVKRHDRKVRLGFAHLAPGDGPPRGVEVDHIAAGNKVKTRPAGPGNCTLWPGCGCMTQSGPHACEGEVP